MTLEGLQLALKAIQPLSLKGEPADGRLCPWVDRLLKQSAFMPVPDDAIEVYVLYDSTNFDLTQGIQEFLQTVARQLSFSQLAQLHNHIISGNLSEDDFIRTFANNQTLRIQTLYLSWSQYKTDRRLESAVQQWAADNDQQLASAIKELETTRELRAKSVESIQIKSSGPIFAATFSTLKTIPTRWEDIAVLLNIESHLIQAIRVDYQGNIAQQMNAMLHTFINSNGHRATLGRLLDALKNIGEHTAAATLRSRLEYFAEH